MSELNLTDLIDQLNKRLPHLSQPEIEGCLNALAPLVNLMAHTGMGTNACLRQGCLPLPVHYYSPVPDLEEMEQRNIWDKQSSMAGIKWNPEEQLLFLKLLGQRYGSECNWPLEATGNTREFHTENGCFCFGCAAAAHSVVRFFKPRRVIEVGSGNSSLVIAGALAANEREKASAEETIEKTDEKTEYTVIDPHPQDFVKELPAVTQVIPQKVELADVDLFLTLQEDDILFIDSSHTVRIGSDVNFLILNVLPRLASGVVVHFHDIHLPREYPKVYLTKPSFRMLWTEAYLLQAFLACNSHFEVLLGMDYLMREQRKAFTTAFPQYNPVNHQLTSGSFWIRRK